MVLIKRQTSVKIDLNFSWRAFWSASNSLALICSTCLIFGSEITFFLQYSAYWQIIYQLPKRRCRKVVAWDVVLLNSRIAFWDVVFKCFEFRDYFSGEILLACGVKRTFRNSVFSTYNYADIVALWFLCWGALFFNC